MPVLTDRSQLGAPLDMFSDSSKSIELKRSGWGQVSKYRQINPFESGDLGTLQVTSGSTIRQFPLAPVAARSGRNMR